MRVALIFEHPEWTRPLVSAFRDRGIALDAFDVGDLRFAPLDPPTGFDIWLNRVNTMPSLGRSGLQVVKDTTRLLETLEERGERVINGLRPHRIGCSKAGQVALFTELGLRHPDTRVVETPASLAGAARQVGYPLVVKPNLGGSGSGIQAFRSEQALRLATGEIDFGIDGLLLVQELIESADGLVHRIETLASRLLYGSAQAIQPGAFNYCAADGCSVDEAGSSIRFEQPPPSLAASAVEFVEAAHADVGSIEYLVDARSGEPSFFDFNPFSNFASGAAEFIGAEPNQLLVDFVLESATRPSSLP